MVKTLCSGLSHLQRLLLSFIFLGTLADEGRVDEEEEYCEELNKHRQPTDVKGIPIAGFPFDVDFH